MCDPAGNLTRVAVGSSPLAPTGQTTCFKYKNSNVIIKFVESQLYLVDLFDFNCHNALPLRGRVGRKPYVAPNFSLLKFLEQ